MPSLEQIVRQLKAKFLRSSIQVDIEWLSGCVQFFLAEDPGTNVDALFHGAHEQWLLSDLADSGIECLPRKITEEKQSHIIDGNFPLQMLYLIDIAEPAYDQLQTLYNKELDEPKEQEQFKQQQQRVSKKKRVLRLQLSDGKNLVTGMEYFPIACLHTKIAPGTKILLSGPMRCINHVLLLESKNVKILGGELESLLIENAFENVLLRALNKPMNPNPKTDYKENKVIESELKPSSQILQNAVPIQSNTISRSDNHLDDLDEDDDIFSNINIDLIETAALGITRNSSTNSNIPQSNEMTNGPARHLRSPSLDMDFLNNVDQIEAIHFLGIDSTRDVNPQQVPAMGLDADDIAMSDDSFDQIVNSHSALMRPQPTPQRAETMPFLDQSYKFKIRGINLVTIEQLARSPLEQKRARGNFILKAELTSIIELVHVTKTAWSLGAILTDNNSKLLRVRFNSEVLEKLAGVSPNEIHEMKELSRTRPQVQEELSEILQILNQKLEQLYCFMKIQFEHEDEIPIVVELIDSAPFLEKRLKEKLDEEK